MIVNRYLTTKPKLLVSQELRRIVSTITKTNEDTFKNETKVKSCFRIIIKIAARIFHYPKIF